MERKKNEGSAFFGSLTKCYTIPMFSSFSIPGFLVEETVGSIVHFPLWWYGEGLLDALRWMGRSLSYRFRAYQLGLWMTHLFTPMYGQYDVASQFISAVVRIAVVIGRCIALLFEAFAYSLLILAWIAAPALFLLLIFRHLV
jgi:hypothetical protein